MVGFYEKCCLNRTKTPGSLGTKSGLIKDERDTVTRRVRHRDGKLLRGGIGLTTGLGWSDRYFFNRKNHFSLFVSLTFLFFLLTVKMKMHHLH